MKASINIFVIWLVFQAVLIALKAENILTYPWRYILTPTWIALGFFIVVFTFATLLWFFDEFDYRRKK